MNSLGDKIKSLRRSLGLSQEQLANQVESTAKSIQRYETGRSRPDVHSLILLATFFDVSTDYLLGLNGIEGRLREEKNKITRQGQYNELYCRYLACINSKKIDETAVYYWIYFGDQDDYGGQSEWVGWADKEKTLEIRRLRPVEPRAAIEICTELRGRPMVLNSKADAEVFRVFGGNAIVKAEICKRYLPEFYEDYIGPNPEYRIWKDL